MKTVLTFQLFEDRTANQSPLTYRACSGLRITFPLIHSLRLLCYSESGKSHSVSFLMTSASQTYQFLLEMALLEAFVSLE